MMKLTIVLLVTAGIAVLTSGQAKAVSLTVAQTYFSAPMEGPGPDVPPVIIKSRLADTAAQGVGLLAEGPGPDVPPVIIKVAGN